MKIYKNPWASHECYFVKSGTAKSYKNEASKSCGYDIVLLENGWCVHKSEYYNKTINEMPFVCSSNTSLRSIIEKAILNEVLSMVEGAKMLMEEDSSDEVD